MPFISSSCAKDLSTPLNATTAFLRPMFTTILAHVNENLKLQYEKRVVTEDEVMRYVLFECASASQGQNYSNMDKEVSQVRSRLFLEIGVKADWPGKDKIQLIRSALRTYRPPRNQDDKKIEQLFEQFNHVSSDTISGCHGWSIDGTLRDRKPVLQPVFNHISLCSVRYSAKLLLPDGDCFADEMVTQPFTLVCGDRGVNTMNLLMECTNQTVPYLGTVRADWLPGDCPIFPKSKHNKFKKCQYLFKVKNSDIYLTCHYEQPGKAPECFLSNFHTGDTSLTLTKRPQISAIYNRCVYNIGAYDFINIHNKKQKSPPSIFEPRFCKVVPDHKYL